MGTEIIFCLRLNSLLELRLRKTTPKYGPEPSRSMFPISYQPMAGLNRAFLTHHFPIKAFSSFSNLIVHHCPIFCARSSDGTWVLSSLKLEKITYKICHKSVAFFSVPPTKFSLLLHFIYLSGRSSPIFSFLSEWNLIYLSPSSSIYPLKLSKLSHLDISKIFLPIWLNLGSSIGMANKFSIF